VSADLVLLRQDIADMRSSRAAPMHMPGSRYDERQRGELNAFDIVLRMIDQYIREES